MQIKTIDIQPLRIPFVVSFTHNSASRLEMNSIIIKIKTKNNFVGMGEGCPRPYVTNETVESTYNFLNGFKHLLLQIKSLKDLKHFIEVHKQEINSNPAAFCAIEIAILDALGKEEGKSVEALLGLPPISGDFQYTAVLGNNSIDTFKKQIQQYSSLGFLDYKIKLCGDIEKDQTKISLLTSSSSKTLRVRFDVNNLWNSERDCINYFKNINCQFFAIEEPITAKQYEKQSIITKKLNTRIILDESFLSFDDFKHIQSNTSNWIINIRISKMGGIIRSLEIANEARERNISIIIGAQVGESSILTRAALVVSNLFKDTIISQEGAFGTHLLSEDICEPCLMFKQKGILETTQFSFPEYPGLGLVFKL